MSALHTTCWPCARKLGLDSTLLPALSERPCEGCGTTVGHKFVPAKLGNQTVMWPGPLVQSYCHFWEWSAWPIAWGIALQDRYGTHVHDWSTHYANMVTGERRENCRCGERREFRVPPHDPTKETK
jgi:hypothetical protein